MKRRKKNVKAKRGTKQGGNDIVIRIASTNYTEFVKN